MPTGEVAPVGHAAGEVAHPRSRHFHIQHRHGLSAMGWVGDMLVSCVFGDHYKVKDKTIDMEFVNGTVSQWVHWLRTMITYQTQLIIWLPIDESAITGVSTITEPAALCYSLLGVLPNDAKSKFKDSKFSRMKVNLEHLSINATEQEVMCTAQTYIMHIIGGVLMPDANNNKVHLMYLPLLTDLQNFRSYSWGSAVLAMLYRELWRMKKPDALDIGICLILLQSWLFIGCHS
ncbi:hypothetical protein PVK06_028406 [Gossypium arboreum]|uniref:Aminotransferase-like plant mobile domain-containing protein n=1 Tax=Gossypium arboreum TaxID=29729 RepID=A0ABR0P2W7_GOSAR|nr:hypothetical protein PVK06_028406 [Gossypium arboreum]